MISNVEKQFEPIAVNWPPRVVADADGQGAKPKDDVRARLFEPAQTRHTGEVIAESTGPAARRRARLQSKTLPSNGA